MDNAMKVAMATPNVPVNNPVGSDTTYRDALNRLFETVNGNVLEGTDWNTWGILSRDKCTKGQFKLVIGSVAGHPAPAAGPYANQADFDEFKKDMERRLAQLEPKLRAFDEFKKDMERRLAQLDEKLRRINRQ
jgi:hypothetical protein